MKGHLRHTPQVHLHQIQDTTFLWLENVSVNCEAMAHRILEGREFRSVTEERDEAIGIVVVQELDGLP